MEDFLQSDYKLPSGSDKYMKLGQGDNRFRILSSAVTGVEFWIETDKGGKKPIRIKEGGIAPDNFVDDPKSFWAFVVWNYQEEKVQILSITQRTIQKSILAISKDGDWGNPIQKYDIVVNKKGTTKDNTEYQTMPKPPTKMDEGILQLYKDLKIDLNALYEGKDPFGEDLVKTEKGPTIAETKKAEEVANEVEAGLKKDKAPF